MPLPTFVYDRVIYLTHFRASLLARFTFVFSQHVKDRCGLHPHKAYRAYGAYGAYKAYGLGTLFRLIS